MSVTQNLRSRLGDMTEPSLSNVEEDGVGLPEIRDKRHAHAAAVTERFAGKGLDK